MNYLVDTNIVSEVRKGRRAHPRLRAWWEGVSPSNIFLSVLTLGEIRSGILRLQHRDPRQAAMLAAWLESLARFFSSRLVAIDAAAAIAWADLSSGRTLPLIDSLIAASAHSRDMTFVTRNTRDIEGSGVRFLDPFQA